MTPEQWKIIEHAHQHRSQLYGLEPKEIDSLHSAGPGADVDLHESWLDYLGKRFGLIAWSSEQEKDSHLRMQRQARSGALLPAWKRNNPNYNKNGTRKSSGRGQR